MKKTIIILIGIGAIVVALGLIYVVFYLLGIANREQAPIAREQRKDEVSDWLTYENEKYGYRVKYPKDWFYEVKSVNEDNLRRVIFDYKKDDKKYIEIVVDSDKTLDDISKELSSLKIYNDQEIIQEKIKLQGLDAIYSTGNFLGYSESVFVEYNNNIFKIEYYIGSREDKSDYELNIFNEMSETLLLR